MHEFDVLLRPTWGVEKWISDAWEILEEKDKECIRSQLLTIQEHALALELKHHKTTYTYTFSLLAQLEVLALQPLLGLYVNDKLSSLKDNLYPQLVDSVFRCLLWTKIVYQQSAPYALPPSSNRSLESLFQIMRDEPSAVVAVVFYNLMTSGWIAEMIKALNTQEIAPKILSFFNAEYTPIDIKSLKDIEVSDPVIIRKKLEQIEEQMLLTLFSQYKYIISVVELLETQGTIEFVQSLHMKHMRQLQDMQLAPTEKWMFFIGTAQTFIPRIKNYCQPFQLSDTSPLRKIFMSFWDNPYDPTMVGQFNLNVSCIDFFNKKYPSETITILILQAVSHGLSKEASFRKYLSQAKFYQTKESYVALVVKLPECGDHLANIVFENCHLMSMRFILSRIHQVIKMMVYCYKKREYLEKKYPYLKQDVDDVLDDWTNDVYGYPIPGNGVVSVSNIGYFGFSGAKSPLFPNEVMKFTMLEIERKMVWNKETQAFETQDILPMSISVDHRVFDGNVPVPKLITKSFDEMFAKFQAETTLSEAKHQHFDEAKMMSIFDNFVERNVVIAYKMLLVMQTYWMDYLGLDMFLAQQFETFEFADIN